MREPVVAQAMTRSITTAVPDTPYRDVVGMLIAARTPEVPVIDATGRLLGVITDASALAKIEFHDGADQPPLLSGARTRRRHRRSTALIAADLMTVPAIMVTADLALSTAIHHMNTLDLRHVCVVDDRRVLVGVLSARRALRVILRDDDVLRRDVTETIRGLGHGSDHITIDVTNGVITLTGTVRFRSNADRAPHPTRPRRHPRARQHPLRIRRHHGCRAVNRDIVMPESCPGGGRRCPEHSRELYRNRHP